MFSISSLRLYTLKSLLIGLGSISCVSVMQTPAEAATLNVPSSQYPTIQSAINAANRGDTIVVEAGRTYTENLVLRYKSGSGYITIQSSALASLPAAGNRVAPSDAANMPTIRSTLAAGTSTISTVSGANPTGYYKLIGLNILRHNSTSQQTAVVSIGTTGTGQDTLAEMPHNIIIDRCLIRGADNAATRRGVLFDAKDSQIINSYIDNFWETGSDSQAILAYNGGQNVLIANNFLEGASENIMLGGDQTSITNFVPNNWTIEHNHFFKRLSWVGASKGVKNLFELKNARDITVRNNVFENHWVDAQSGPSIVFTPRNSGSEPWVTIENVTFEYNIVKNVSAGFNILTTDDINTSEVVSNFDINNNLIEIYANSMGGGLGRAFLFHGSNARGPVQGLTVDHNTIIHRETGEYKNTFIESDGAQDIVSGLSVTNNIVAGVTGGFLGYPRGGYAGGAAQLARIAVGDTYTFTGNVIQRSSSGMPASSFYTTSLNSIGFEDYAGRNYALKSNSPYRGAAPGNKDIGADIAGLISSTACVVSGRQSDCAAATSSAAYDFDGDRKSDASLYRPTDGVWYLNRSRDGSTGVNFGIATDKIAPADYDGDGKTDVAVFRPEQNIWYVLNSSNWSVSVRYFGSVGDVPVHADYDADGKADFAVWRPSNGVWYRFNSSDGQFVAAQFGLAGDRPSVGDYDGDGRSDLAVYRPTTGVWYLLRSTDGFAAFTFGLPGDVVTPADYTGDGRTDIAVYRPSNGTWYRFDQSNGQMSVFQFGLATDVPTPGDYDGDGKTDLAVYRPSNGTWYFQKSTEGFFSLRYGSAGDIPVASAVFN